VLQLRGLLANVAADEPCAVFDGFEFVRETTIGVAFQILENSRIGSVESGLVSPVGP
jgi:hypothetical protein